MLLFKFTLSILASGGIRCYKRNTTSRHSNYVTALGLKEPGAFRSPGKRISYAACVFFGEWKVGNAAI